MARRLTTLVAGTGAFALALAVPMTTAVAQSDGQVVLTNTETVNASLDPSGNPDVIRVYDQIAIQGSGEVSYRNPVSVAGLRNLDGFANFTVEDDSIVEETSVDGQLRRRTVSDFELDLPVSISVAYTLDGEPIEPSDLVGKTGELEVVYTIENMTGEPEEVEIVGADGETTTETLTVYDPLAGSLTFTLPSNFTDVTSDSGFVTAGDGRGGTLMTLSITLISGLTEQVVEAGYRAQVEDAVIPPASMSIIPVIVTENPSSAAQLEALQGGAQTGRDLADGAGQIDENLLRLASGAGDLVDGLILLRNGSAELSDGLVNTAAPGSAELAAGAGELAAGLNGTAVPGSAALAAGAGELAAGLNGTAVPGSAALADGAGDLSAGLLALQGNVPALVAGVIQLDEGAQELEAGLQQLQSQVPALVGGVTQLSDGADELEAGLKQLQSQIPDLVDGVAQLATGSATLAGGLNQLEQGLDAPLAQQGFGAGLQFLADELDTAAGAGGLADQVIGGIDQIKGAPDCGAQCQLIATGVSDNVDTAVRAEVQAASDGASGLNTGYTTTIRPTIAALSTGADNLQAGLASLQSQLGPLEAGVNALVAGAEKLAAGLSQLEANTGPLADGVDRLAAGATRLSDGLSQLRASVDPLADGVNQLADGGEQVADGADQLADGLVGAGDGANQVADGADQLATGLVEAGDGANQVADGAGRLADGLGDAADGSVQLANGLEDAAEAAPAIPDGAQQLSEEGTSQLVAAGQETALTFGQRVAVLQAAADRTADGGLPFGAPTDAIAAAAYRYDLAGANGVTAQNTGRLLAGLLIGGGAAAAATVVARRQAA